MKFISGKGQDTKLHGIIIFRIIFSLDIGQLINIPQLCKLTSLNDKIDWKKPRVRYYIVVSLLSRPA